MKESLMFYSRFPLRKQSNRLEGKLQLLNENISVKQGYRGYTEFITLNFKTFNIVICSSYKLMNRKEDSGSVVFIQSFRFILF